MLRIILCVFIPLFFNYNNLSSPILKLSGGINRTWMNEKPFDAPCLTYTAHWDMITCWIVIITTGFICPARSDI